MKATVTMPLSQYEGNKRLLENLQKMIKDKNKEIEDLLAITVEQETQIHGLKDHAMESEIYTSRFQQETLENLLKTSSFDDSILIAFWSHSSDRFKKLGITIDDQRDFITRKYNEYQAQKQQEELENGSK